MRTKSAAWVLVILVGCAQAQRHPPIAIGIAGAIVGGLACEMDSPSRQSTCGIISAAVGLGLGGITGLVTLFADTEDHTIPSDDEMEGSAIRVHTHTALPTVVLDAGPVAPDAAPAIDAALDAGAIDAQPSPP